jgi:hypothetical protein
MTTAIETDKYNLLYGKILSIVKDVSRSKALTNVLYQISNDLGMSNDQVLKYVTATGLRFDNKIYEQLNAARTNSSQIGFLDENNVPSRIAQQVV